MKVGAVEVESLESKFTDLICKENKCLATNGEYHQIAYEERQKLLGSGMESETLTLAVRGLRSVGKGK